MVYLAEWDCGKCQLKLRAFFKKEDVLGIHFNGHAVACPACGVPEDLVVKPYQLDKQISGDRWEIVWSR